VKKTSSNKAERLNKILAAAGIASRRRADELISQGLVTVNGRKETKLGSQAVWGIDAIAVNGQPIPAPPKEIYLILNKPFGYVCTLRDPEGRPTVRDLTERVRERIFPVGRLDLESEGLLLVTDDGELANRLTHPRFEHEKEYLVRIEGKLRQHEKARLEKGIQLEEGITATAKVKEVTSPPYNYSLTIHEGRKRQVRRMFERLKHPVIDLKRVRIGGLEMGSLKEGEARRLSREEIKILSGD